MVLGSALLAGLVINRLWVLLVPIVLAAGLLFRALVVTPGIEDDRAALVFFILAALVIVDGMLLIGVGLRRFENWLSSR